MENSAQRKSLNVLWEANARGYVLAVERDNTFTVTKNGTTYLRSNDDIQRFGRVLVPPISYEE